MFASSFSTLKLYFNWIPIFILTAFHNVCSILVVVGQSLLLCTVEVSGPKRFIGDCDYENSLKVLTAGGRVFKLYYSLLRCLNPLEESALLKITAPPQTSAENSYVKYGNAVPNVEHYLPFYQPLDIQYKSQWVRVERSKMFDDETRFPHEMVTLTTYRYNRKLLDDLLQHAADHFKEANEASGKVQIYTPADEDSDDEFWTEMEPPKPKRSLDTVILAEGVKERIVKDLKRFVDSKEEYFERDIPFRRGYLLYGPPGCGKSSFVRAIASELNYGICLLTLSSDSLSDFRLSALINGTPEKSIILIEDIGAVFQSREDEEASSAERNLTFGGAMYSRVTFSGLLNALDGVCASDTDGRIIFMTTNHIDNLDPALIRPGRIDYKIKVDLPNDSQIAQMFTRFWVDDEGTSSDNDNNNGTDKVSSAESEKKRIALAQEFVTKVRAVKDVEVTMAMLQGLFVLFKNEKDRRKVVDYVKEYLEGEIVENLLRKKNENLDFYM